MSIIRCLRMRLIIHIHLLMPLRQFERTFKFNVPNKHTVLLIICNPSSTVFNVLDEDMKNVQVSGECLLKFEIVRRVPKRQRIVLQTCTKLAKYIISNVISYPLFLP